MLHPPFNSTFPLISPVLYNFLFYNSFTKGTTIIIPVCVPLKFPPRESGRKNYPISHLHYATKQLIIVIFLPPNQPRLSSVLIVTVRHHRRIAHTAAAA